MQDTAIDQQPAVLLVTTQTWLQATRIAMRLISYGARLCVICPEESSLDLLDGIQQTFRFQTLRPMQSLRRAIHRSGAEYLLPADDLATLFLHELWNDAPELRPIIERSLGNSRFFSIARSRPQFLQLASSLGIRIPETQVVTEQSHLDEWHKQSSFPCVLKRDCTWGGNGVEIASNAAAATAAFTRLQKGSAYKERALRWLRNGDGSAFARLACEEFSQVTVQSHIDGVPANAMFAAHEGKILGELQAQVLISIGSIGPSLAIQILRDPRITEAGAKIAEAMQLSGFFGLDFMLERETGTPVLLELNPRMTRLGHLGLEGAPDLTGQLWQQWSGAAADHEAELKAGDLVAFFPDGQTAFKAIGLAAHFRTDISAGEETALRTLVLREKNRQTHLSRRAWKTLARLKKGMLQQAATPPYHHRLRIDHAERGQHSSKGMLPTQALPAS